MTQAATTRTEQIQQLRDILTDVLEVEPDELTETSHFVNDHGADSLMAIDIISSIERDMGVHLPNEVLPELTTLTAVLEVLERYSRASDE
ncbi:MULTISPECIES: acyl carrier protein [unclassified Spirillospora]|uniref:acyl carrier protein n=1 Tax=unclassified Spirillospora TaxID=2642701 RepID=UPI003715E246